MIQTIVNQWSAVFLRTSTSMQKVWLQNPLLSPMRRNFCSLFCFILVFLPLSCRKSQKPRKWTLALHWTLYEGQIHDSPALCQRSFLTNWLLCTTTRHMYCFQVWDYATITASTGKNAIDPTKQDGVVYRIPCECNKVYISSTSGLMQ